MTRIFRAPAFYVQGPGALDELGGRVSPLGRRIVVLCDAGVLPMVEERLRASLQRQDIDALVAPFDGQVSLADMDGLAGFVRGEGAELVVGVGGGRTLDAAKGAARRTGLPFVSVPTVASTDAPATRGVVVYDERHRIAAVEQMADNPALVLADTALLAAAPPRFLRAGIGDALTTKFEAEACRDGSGLTKHGARPLASGVLFAQMCYRTLLSSAEEALAAAGSGRPTPAFEETVEAVLLMSAVGFENSGLSVAHAVASELGAIPAVHAAALHGEQAAYGTLVQIVAEGRPPAELDEVFGFVARVGLPDSLPKLGLEDVSGEAIDALAHAVSASPFMVNQKRRLSAGEIAEAIRAVEDRAARARPDLARAAASMEGGWR